MSLKIDKVICSHNGGLGSLDCKKHHCSDGQIIYCINLREEVALAIKEEMPTEGEIANFLYHRKPKELNILGNYCFDSPSFCEKLAHTIRKLMGEKLCLGEK